MALVAALVAVAGTALNAKVARNTAVDPDTVTASAAGAGGSGGVPLDIEAIEGTEVSGEGITPFAYKPYDAAISEELTEDEIRALLEEQGGVMSAASGRYLNRGTGGGITFELLQQLFGSEKLKESGFDSIEEMLAANTPPVDEIVAYGGDAIPMPDQRVGINKPDINVDPRATIPERRGGLMGLADNLGLGPTIDKIGAFAETNPKVFNAVIDVFTDAIKASGKRGNRQSTDRVDSTPLMAGNAAGRRIQYQPIGAKHGGTLNRPMFMPNGGAMRGPGGPKEDLIPVMASNGEYMLSKAAVDQAGSGNHNKGIARLNAFNKQGNKRYG